MIRLSKRLLYTIDAVLDVALHEDAGPVRSSEITDREEIAALIQSQQIGRDLLRVGHRSICGRHCRLLGCVVVAGILLSLWLLTWGDIYSHHDRMHDSHY